MKQKVKICEGMKEQLDSKNFWIATGDSLPWAFYIYFAFLWEMKSSFKFLLGKSFSYIWLLKLAKGDTHSAVR